jgi:hypothetical protein
VSVHDYHDGLPGFDERQVLHDGCGECEARGANVSLAIGSMDKGRFALAWRRAADWNRIGVANISRAEMPLLNALWAIQIKLETVCGVPVGELPYAADRSLR